MAVPHTDDVRDVAAQLPTQDSDEVIADLLEQLLQRARDGQEIDIPAVCRDYPELASEIRELWATVMVAEDLVSGVDDVEGSGKNDRTASNTATVGHLIEPRTVGDFELLAELGRGGMGVVYRGRYVVKDRSLSCARRLSERFSFFSLTGCRA